MGKVIWFTVSLAVLLVAWLMVRHADDPLVVKTSTGLVKGKQSVVDNQTCASFLGIPYAKPPIGTLRFSRPQMIDSWTHTHNAQEYGADCFSNMHFGPTHKESEDCLFLNVWVPGSSSGGPRPVIVNIHGGGFVAGNGRFSGDRFSIQTDTIVVSMNYRLNSFGFLNLYTEEAPGNMGLLDQQLAMTWVKKNIEAFGGDSNRITIMGISAGGASVGYHLLSPKSHELFNRGITQSGSPTGYWAFDSKVTATSKAMELADLAQCNRFDAILNPKGLVECLQQVPAKDLNKMSKTIKLIKPFTFAFVPTMDGHFLSATPYELLSQGDFKKTEIIIGTNEREGSLFLYPYFPDYMMKGLLTIDQVVDITEKSYPDLSGAQLAAVHRHYFGASDPNNTVENTKQTGNMLGDNSFLCSSNFLADMVAKFGGKVHYYNFVHNKGGTWVGASHGTDAMYMLKEFREMLKIDLTEEEENLGNRMIAQWAAFAESGDPSTADYKWPVYDEETRRYHKVDVGPPITAEGGPRTRHCKFWDDIGKIEQSTVNPNTVG